MHKVPLRGYEECETYFNLGTFLEPQSELATVDSLLDEHLHSGKVTRISGKK
jgi:hypothetical protein